MLLAFIKSHTLNLPDAFLLCIMLSLAACASRTLTVPVIIPEPDCLTTEQDPAVNMHPDQNEQQNNDNSKRPPEIIRFDHYVAADSFCIRYPNACSNLEGILAANKELIHKVLRNTYYLDPAFVLAIAAPELSWYGKNSDQMETLAAEIFYTQLGPEYADFSLGLFQMKPSFAEKLEQKYTEIIDTNMVYGDYDEFTYFEEDEEKIRKKRLERLKDKEYQLIYLAKYYKYMEERHSNKHFCKPADKLIFYAAAYNCGFDRPDAEIMAYASKSLFPYGNKWQNYNLPYARVAASLFNNGLLNAVNSPEKY